jgi:DNA-binding MarR family transcriptional regulator
LAEASQGNQACRGRVARRTEFNTTLPRFDVMAALSRYPKGLKMSELSGVLKVSNGNVTGLVDRLADEGLLERVAVPGDRRASLVRLTAQGRADFAVQAEAHARWIDVMLRDFSEARSARSGRAGWKGSACKPR